MPAFLEGDVGQIDWSFRAIPTSIHLDLDHHAVQSDHSAGKDTCQHAFDYCLGGLLH
jgi:hypothetical protein